MLQRNYESRYADGNGGFQIHYRDFPGTTDKTVVFLHGLTANSTSFYTIIDLLGEEYRCIAVDLCGRGLSDHAPEGSYGVQAHAKNVEALLDSLDLKDVVFLAHSFGCYVSMVVAAKRPDLVHGLVMIEGGKVSITQEELEKMCAAGLQRTQMVFPSLEAYFGFWHQTAPYMNEDAWTPYFDEYIESDVRDLGDGTVQCRAMPEAIAEDTRKGFTEYEPEDCVPKVTAPLVLVWADTPLIGDKPMYSEEALRSVCDLAGGPAEFLEVYGANHMDVIYNPVYAQQVAQAARNMWA